jgi:hypothetical protein
VRNSEFDPAALDDLAWWVQRDRKFVLGDCPLSVVSCQLSVVSGQWSVVSGHWSLVIGHWSLVIGQLSVGSGQWALGFALSTKHQTLSIVRETSERNGASHRLRIAQYTGG